MNSSDHQCDSSVSIVFKLIGLVQHINDVIDYVNKMIYVVL